MTVSDKDLAAKQAKVVKLREQVANEIDKRVQRETDLGNEITFKQLQVEEDRLEAELAHAKEQNKVAVVKAGSPLSQVEDTEVPAASPVTPVVSPDTDKKK